jgi:hypothetical protein
VVSVTDFRIEVDAFAAITTFEVDRSAGGPDKELYG